jgi:hypothetical protein
MDPWLEAAQHYASLDERGRHDYWQRLSAEQQAALTKALTSPELAATAAQAPVHASGPPPAKGGGILSTLATGCGGFVLGIILTIAIQVFAVMAGMRSFKSYVDRSVAEEDANRLHCDPPRDAKEAQDCYNSSESQIEIRRQQRLEKEQEEGQ